MEVINFWDVDWLVVRRRIWVDAGPGITERAADGAVLGRDGVFFLDWRGTFIQLTLILTLEGCHVNLIFSVSREVSPGRVILSLTLQDARNWLSFVFLDLVHWPIAVMVDQSSVCLGVFFRCLPLSAQWPGIRAVIGLSPFLHEPEISGIIKMWVKFWEDWFIIIEGWRPEWICEIVSVWIRKPRPCLCLWGILFEIFDRNNTFAEIPGILFGTCLSLGSNMDDFWR